jgi:hypothetical protein
VVDYLSGNCGSLSSIPSTTKKQTNKLKQFLTQKETSGLKGTHKLVGGLIWNFLSQLHSAELRLVHINLGTLVHSRSSHPLPILFKLVEG